MWVPKGGRGLAGSVLAALCSFDAFQALRKQRVNDSHIKWLQMCGKVWGDRTASLLVFTQEPAAASRGSAEHI